VWRQVRVVDQRGLFAGVEPRTALFVIPGAVPFFGIWFLLLLGAGSGPCPVPFGFHVPVALVLLGWLLWGLGCLAVWRFVHRACTTCPTRARPRWGRWSTWSPTRVTATARPPTPSPWTTAAATSPSPTRSMPATFAELRFGSWLRLQVTPKLRHVANAEVVRDDGPLE
jgi:hypothetical protein